MASNKKDAAAVPAVQIKKAGAVKPAEAPQGPAKVEGKKVSKLVQVDYKGDNTHILFHVHAVSPGLNHLDEAVLDEALKHPANAHLVKSGKLVVLSAPPKGGKKGKGASEPEAPPADDAPPAADAVPPVVAGDEDKK